MWALVCGSQDNKDLLRTIPSGLEVRDYYYDESHEQGEQEMQDDFGTVSDSDGKWQETAAKFLVELRRRKRHREEMHKVNLEKDEEDYANDHEREFTGMKDHRPKQSKGYLYMLISTTTFLLLGGIVAAYLAMGALYFKPTEANADTESLLYLKKTRESLFQSMKEDYAKTPNQTTWTVKASVTLANFEGQLGKIFRKRLGAGGGDIANVTDIIWTIYGSTVFCASIITSIGWGNVVPKTDKGRLSCVVYAIFGIPLLFSFASALSTLLNTLAENIWNLFTSGIQAIKPGSKHSQSEMENLSANKTLNRISSWHSLIFSQYFNGDEKITGKRRWTRFDEDFSSSTFDKGDGLWETFCRINMDSSYYSSLHSTIDYMTNAVDDPNLDALTRPHYCVTEKDVVLLSRHFSQLDLGTLEKCMLYAGVEAPIKTRNSIPNLEEDPISCSTPSVISYSGSTSLSSLYDVDVAVEYEPSACANVSSEDYSAGDHFANTSIQSPESFLTRSHLLSDSPILERSLIGDDQRQLTCTNHYYGAGEPPEAFMTRSSSLPISPPLERSTVSHDQRQPTCSSQYYGASERSQLEETLLTNPSYSSETFTDKPTPRRQLCNAFDFDSYSYHFDASSGDPQRRHHDKSEYVDFWNESTLDGSYIKYSFGKTSDDSEDYDDISTTPGVNSKPVNVINDAKEVDFSSNRTWFNPVLSNSLTCMKHKNEKASVSKRSRDTESLLLNNREVSNMAQYSIAYETDTKSPLKAFQTKLPISQIFQNNSADRKIPMGTTKAINLMKIDTMKSSEIHEEPSDLYIKHPTPIVTDLATPNESIRTKYSMLQSNDETSNVGNHNIPLSTKTLDAKDKRLGMTPSVLPRSQMENVINDCSKFIRKYRNPENPDFTTMPLHCRSRHAPGVMYPSGCIKETKERDGALNQTEPFDFFRHETCPAQKNCVNIYQDISNSFCHDLDPSRVRKRSRQKPIKRGSKSDKRHCSDAYCDEHVSDIDPNVDYPTCTSNSKLLHGEMRFPSRQYRNSSETMSRSSKTHEGKTFKPNFKNVKMLENANANRLDGRKTAVYKNKRRWDQCQMTGNSLHRMNTDCGTSNITINNNSSFLDEGDIRYDHSRIMESGIGIEHLNKNSSKDHHARAHRRFSDELLQSEYSVDNSDDEDAERSVPFIIYLILVGLFVVLGMFLFKSLSEKESLINGLYFTVVMLTTIGFGDIIPTEEYYLTLVWYGFLGLALANFVTNKIIESILDTVDLLNRFGDPEEYEDGDD